MVRLIFTRNDTIWSSLIRWAQWSEYSHVSVIIGDDVISARFWGGVQREALSSLLAHASGYIVATVDASDKKRVEAFILGEVGKPYDWKAVIGIGIHRDWHDDKAWCCSELVAAALEYAGTRVVSKQISRVTPQDLLQSPLVICQERGEKT